MKVILLAGGYGTRISEESHLKPKPMIEIGGAPILWHIMKYYASQGLNDFIICCGYKGYIIKEYFNDYFLHRSDITFDFQKNKNEITVHNNFSEPWKVTLIDTGLDTMTGGRIKRVKDYIGNETFMMTYGDGVSDVDLKSLLAFHKQNKGIVTVTSIQPDGRFGVLEIENGKVTRFAEKKREDGHWINGGFMVIEPEIFNFIEGDSTVFEKAPLEKVASLGKLFAYKHTGFWQCMDTIRDKNYLEDLIKEKKAPWITWK